MNSHGQKTILFEVTL